MGKSEGARGSAPPWGVSGSSRSSTLAPSEGLRGGVVRSWSGRAMCLICGGRAATVSARGGAAGSRGGGTAPEGLGYLEGPRGGERRLHHRRIHWATASRTTCPARSSACLALADGILAGCAPSRTLVRPRSDAE